MRFGQVSVNLTIPKKRKKKRVGERTDAQRAICDKAKHVRDVEWGKYVMSGFVPSREACLASDIGRFTQVRRKGRAPRIILPGMWCDPGPEPDCVRWALRLCCVGTGVGRGQAGTCVPWSLTPWEPAPVLTGAHGLAPPAVNIFTRAGSSGASAATSRSLPGLPAAVK